MPTASRLSGAFQKPVIRRAALFLAAFAIGLVASHGIAFLMPFAFFWLPLFRFTRKGWEQWLPPTGYFGGFLLTMFPGAAIFYGHSFDPFGITLLWVSVTLLLSAPWALLCNSSPRRLLWAVPFAIVASAIPPLGLFDIGNPINATGMLLPHTGWYGLAALTLLSGFFATRPRIAIPIAVALSLTAFMPRPTPPRSWTAISTKLGGQGLDTPSDMREYEAAQYIQQAALDAHSSVIVFPESLVMWNSSTELFWKPTLDSLKAHGKTLIVGSTMQFPGARPGYRNTAVVRGAQHSDFDQRIPIPVTMWHPLTNDGVPLQFDGPAVLPPIAGTTAAPLICYEQLLPWPILRSAMQRPRLFLGMANDYWARGTYFPAIQTANLESWSRLFDIPYIAAVNQ